MSGYYHPQYPGGYSPQQQHPQQQHPQAAYYAQPVYQHPPAPSWPPGSQYTAHPGSATPAPQQWPQQAAGYYASAYSQQMHLNQGYSTQPYVDPRMSMHSYMAQQTPLPPQPVTPAPYPPQAYPQTVMTPVQTGVARPWGQHIPNGSTTATTTAPATTIPSPSPTTSSTKRPLPSPGASRPRPESLPPNSLSAVSVISNPSHNRINPASQAPATTNSLFPRSSFDGIGARPNEATASSIANRWPPPASSMATGTPITTSTNTSRPSLISKGDESDGGKRPLPALPPSVFGARALRRSGDASSPAAPHSPVTEAVAPRQPPEKATSPAGSPSQPAAVISTPSPNPTKRSLPTAPGGGGIQPGTVLPKSPAGPSRSTTLPNTSSQSSSSIPTTSSLPVALSRGSSAESATTAVASDDDKRPLWRRMAAAAGDPRAQGSSLSSRSITPSSRMERTSSKPPPTDLPKVARHTQSQTRPQHQRAPSLPSTSQPVVSVAPKTTSVVPSPSRQVASPQPSTSRPTSVVVSTPNSHQRTSSVPAPSSMIRPRKDPVQVEEGGQPRMSMFMKRASMSLQEHKNEDWVKWAMKSATSTSPGTSPHTGPTARPTSVGSASSLDLDDAPPQAVHRGSFGNISSGSKSPASAPQRQLPSSTRVAHQKRASSKDADRTPHPTYKPSYSDSEDEGENTSHPQIVVSTAVPQISVHTAANDRAPKKDVTPPRQPPASPKVPTINVMVEKPRKKSSAPAPPQVVPSFSFSVDGEDDETAPQQKEKPLPPKVQKGSSRCGACEKAILGRIINAMGARWHPECFRCGVCDTGLEHISSYEHDDRPYCHLCYHEVSHRR
jgi:LIM domain